MKKAKMKYGNRIELSAEEIAYRRGVHQALGMLRNFVDETGIDAYTALSTAAALAADARSTAKACDWLMTVILAEVDRVHGE